MINISGHICMCVCVYVCMYVCVHTHTCIHIKKEHKEPETLIANYTVSIIDLLIND
jgi:hypothetical protein